MHLVSIVAIVSTAVLALGLLIALIGYWRGSDLEDYGIGIAVVATLPAVLLGVGSLIGWQSSVSCERFANEVGAEDWKWGHNNNCRVQLTEDGVFVPEENYRVDEETGR